MNTEHQPELDLIDARHPEQIAARRDANLRSNLAEILRSAAQLVEGLESEGAGVSLSSIGVALTRLERDRREIEAEVYAGIMNDQPRVK